MVENIKIPDGNFSLGPNSGNYYSVNKSTNVLNELTNTGVIADSFFVDRSLLRNPVTTLQYDGAYFWTLEDLPSDLGIVIKRWRIFPVPTQHGLPAGSFPTPSPVSFTWQDQLTLIHAPNIRYSSEAFCVEHYHSTLGISAAQTDTVLTFASVDNISPGDIITLGPSTLTGFIDHAEDVTVLSVNTFFERSNNFIGVRQLLRHK